MNNPTLDENLILRMGTGDQQAFADFYRQTCDSVYGFALSIVKNRQDAEDIMHDAYLRSFSAAASYRPMGKPLAWLLTIVKNTGYNLIRSRGICEDLSQYEHAAAADEHAFVLDRMVLEEVLKTLAALERQILILHAVAGFKHKEIASLLGLPLGTVLSKYSRALKKVRTSLERKEWTL